MQNTYKIKEDLFYLGANDRRLALFENLFPLEKGVSYNSYLLKDKKNVLFDLTDISVLNQFLENLDFALGGENLDYIIINHMEPDHSSILQIVYEKYPDAQIICNQKAKDLISQFFNFDVDTKVQVVQDNQTLEIGKHILKFIFAPMVHWPETMVTYDLTDKILFSGDAFGSFGTLDGNIFADEVDFQQDWMPEFRRYYTNIVGKFGLPVQALLKKLPEIQIDMICPLHGNIFRKDFDLIIDKYQKWSKYEPEENSVVILYGSIYGNTQNCAEIIARKLAIKGVKNIKLYDVSKTHFSYLVAEAFRCSHIIVACATYNVDIFTSMKTVLEKFKSLCLQNKKVAIIENGSWCVNAGRLIENIFKEMKNMEIIEPKLTLKSSLKPEQLKVLDELVDNVFKTL